METTTWSVAVPFYPVNFNKVTFCVLQYMTTFVNKFVPELNGVLIDFDKNSLNIITSSKSISKFGLFHICPELNHLRIRAQIKVHVFHPKYGLELNGTVSIVKPHIILCNTEIPSIVVSLPRSSDTITEQSNSNNNQINQANMKLSQLKPNDNVKIRIVNVVHNLGSLIIHGELVEFLYKSITSTQALVKIFDETSSHSSDDDDDGESNYINKMKTEVDQSIKREESFNLKIESSDESTENNQRKIKKPKIDNSSSMISTNRDSLYLESVPNLKLENFINFKPIKEKNSPPKQLILKRDDNDNTINDIKPYPSVNLNEQFLSVNHNEFTNEETYQMIEPGSNKSKNKSKHSLLISSPETFICKPEEM